MKTDERKIDIIYGRHTNICVELTDEAGEVVVLEENRQESLREFKWIKNDETIISSSPSDEIISAWIINHLISLDNKRCDNVVVFSDIH